VSEQYMRECGAWNFSAFCSSFSLSLTRFSSGSPNPSLKALPKVTPQMTLEDVTLTKTSRYVISWSVSCVYYLRASITCVLGSRVDDGTSGFDIRVFPLIEAWICVAFSCESAS
jgi:hypothetical protein